MVRIHNLYLLLFRLLFSSSIRHGYVACTLLWKVNIEGYVTGSNPQSPLANTDTNIVRYSYTKEAVNSGLSFHKRFVHIKFITRHKAKVEYQSGTRIG